jgi:hypothetical protein
LRSFAVTEYILLPKDAKRNKKNGACPKITRRKNASKTPWKQFANDAEIRRKRDVLRRNPEVRIAKMRRRRFS